MIIEGVDYSTDSPGSAALKAAGKSFVVRYMARDSRGLDWNDGNERNELESNGIDVAVVYESTEGRMLEGADAGVYDAGVANARLLELGLPAAMPIYFACDTDAAPEDQVAIDAYLRGAASVIGAPRVGVYGGYWVVSRCAANKSAAWFWQTSAWSGGNVFAGNHLYQYEYNLWINGTNCDATQALQDNYGQASKFRNPPPPSPVPAPKPKPGPAPKPKPPAPKPGVVYPPGMDKGIATRAFGSVKASNGVTVSYSEGDELSNLWLASGSFGRIVDVGVYVDSPTVTRLVYQFSDGCMYGRPNDHSPMVRLK